jgi:hypothetical protein
MGSRSQHLGIDGDEMVVRNSQIKEVDLDLYFLFIEYNYLRLLITLYISHC